MTFLNILEKGVSYVVTGRSGGKETMVIMLAVFQINHLCLTPASWDHVDLQSNSFSLRLGYILGMLLCQEINNLDK